MNSFLSPKIYTYGTHRFCDPTKTFARIVPHFHAMGLTRVADVTGLDVIGVPVCVAVRPNAKSLAVSQGKGMTLMLAKVSAAMESIELYHAEHIDLDQTLTGSFAELSSSVAICNPVTLNLHPDTNYDGHLPIRWMKGFDLLQQETVFVPYDLVHCVWISTMKTRPTFASSSNGLASGNHPLEAINHAICEVIERHETYIWQLRTLLPSAQTQYLDLDSVDSSSCQELLGKLSTAGIATHIWDLSSTFGIPTFGCVILEETPTLSFTPIGVFHGFGTHLSKEIACVRAITEAIQSRLTFISGSRDDTYRESYKITQSDMYQRRWKDLLQSSQPVVDYRRVPSLATEQLDADLDILLAQLRAHGCQQVIMVDLTRDDFNIPVVKVIIPGLKDARH